jgi:hypothetical protein
MNEKDLLDRALAAVDAELPDAAVTAAAMHRVHARLAAESGAVAEAAGLLHAVRHVEDDREAERAQDREAAHVDHEVVVAEGEAALGPTAP